jgi:hypothetical protein
MKVVFERKREKELAQRLGYGRHGRIGKTDDTLQHGLAEQRAKIVRTRNEAAMKIEAIYRGHQGRKIAADRREVWYAALDIQRVFRGSRGRNIAYESRMSGVRVVQTKYQLKNLRLRSVALEQVSLKATDFSCG